jgi:hypothetical protein
MGPDEEIALKHYQAGAKYYETGAYENALREFEIGQRRSPSPAFDFNIARCLDRLERVPEAIVAYEKYLANVPPPADAAEVRVRIDRLRALAPTPAALPPARHSLGGTAIAAIALGASAVVIGATATALFGVTKADADGRTTGCCTRTDVDPLYAQRNASYALWGVAGAALVVDVAMIALAVKERRARRVVAAGQGGFAF